MFVALRRHVGLLCLLLALSPYAAARDLIYSFSITWASGPLAWTVDRGLVGFDSSLAIPNAEYSAPNLLTRFQFRMPDRTYELADVTSAFLSFDASGKLRQVLFGTHCSPMSCFSDVNDPQTLYFNYISVLQPAPLEAVHGLPVPGVQSLGYGTLRLISR